MRVQVAAYRDVRGWLDLVAEVEPLFGGMLDDPAFYQALLRNVARRTAFCVRAADGPPGAPLAGGLLVSPRRPDRPRTGSGGSRSPSGGVAAGWAGSSSGTPLVSLSPPPS
jgi:hypothetical protein